MPPLYAISLLPGVGGIRPERDRYEVDHDGFRAFQPIRRIWDGHYKFVLNLRTTGELDDLETDLSEIQKVIDPVEHAVVRNDLHDHLLIELQNYQKTFPLVLAKAAIATRFGTVKNWRNPSVEEMR